LILRLYVRFLSFFFSLSLSLSLFAFDYESVISHEPLTIYLSVC